MGAGGKRMIKNDNKSTYGARRASNVATAHPAVAELRGIVIKIKPHW